jgi:RNA polymerase sigma-70 factor, ECF subfamily
MNRLPLAPPPTLTLEANPIASPAPETRDVRVRRMVDAYFDPLWRFLRRLGVDPMDLDDAMQEVVEIAASRLEGIPLTSERSFLFSTAFRVGGEFRRRRARRREVGDDPLANELDPGPEPDDLTDQVRARRMLDQLLATMPTDLRAVFTLYEIEEMTMAEIGEVLEVSQGTVASRLRRAREQFEARVDRWQAQMRSAERMRRKEIAP